MEDDVFLRCIEANLLSDMSLQGIEAIGKVNSSLIEKMSLWGFATRQDSNQPAQLHKPASVIKLQI